MRAGLRGRWRLRGGRARLSVGPGARMPIDVPELDGLGGVSGRMNGV